MIQSITQEDDTRYLNERRRGPSGSRELRFVLFGLLLLFTFAGPVALRDIFRETLANAYIQVSAFVAVTLFLFYVVEYAFKLNTNEWLTKYRKLEIPIACLMGAMPGCGGAIIVITQYVSGNLSFAAVVAVLCSTMGDAAFLLLAQAPEKAALVYLVCFISGNAMGYLVHFIHGRKFLMHETECNPRLVRAFEPNPHIRFFYYPWALWMIPGFILGVGNAFQVDTDIWFGSFSAYHPTQWIGVMGALLCILVWACSRNAGPSLSNLSGKRTDKHGLRIHLERVMIDTNFVTVWVVMAFLTYNLFLHFTGFDLKEFFAVWQPLMPLVGILIGFIPGCGPQIIVTSLYLQGLIPLSAQLGNAISNDGDALFPAIALAPKAAFLATLYTAVPALIVAYLWYFLFETHGSIIPSW